MDLEDGFHQMPLHQDSKKYTTFSTPFGSFQWNVLPTGIKVAPQAFRIASNGTGMPTLSRILTANFLAQRRCKEMIKTPQK